MNLFWEKGYNGTSINDLVNATGLSRSSLYATYIDKHALFMAALKRYQELNGTWLASRLEKYTSARDKIEAIFRMLVNATIENDYGKGCLMVNSATEMANQNKEIARVASQDFAGMEEMFYTLIKQGQANGEISKDHKARALAQFLFNNYIGLRVVGQTNQDKARLDAVVRMVMNVLE